MLKRIVHFSIVSVFICSMLFSPKLQAVSADVEVEKIALTSSNFDIDPGLESSSDSIFLINQLFSGLFRLDPETSRPIADMASGWSVSENGLEWTIGLKDNLQWSNGFPIGASDVRFAILRNLAPATSAPFAYVLGQFILGASEYHNGITTDPNTVGVEVLDPLSVKFTLTSPYGYFPSILALPVAKPLPENTINLWGDTWTAPNHIVTSGAYTLAEYVPESYAILTKSDHYFDQANVSIDEVKVYLGYNIGYDLYMQGLVDTTAQITSLQLDSIKNDPVYANQYYKAPSACSYDYFFNPTIEPFNNPLVRKALIAATDRSFASYQFPAITLTPKPLFGAIDDITEGIGIPYNPEQARQYLADAGYPNGVGFPTITINFNTSIGHQTIAENVATSWISVLGINVELKSYSWQEFLIKIGNGEFGVFRNGWCNDNFDADNFVGDYIQGSLKNWWNNPSYNSLLLQAREETNYDERLNLYKQIEEILVETDAVVLPLYHYSYNVLTRPYLNRTYLSGMEYVKDWQVLRTETDTVEGATSFDQTGLPVTLEFYANTFDQPATVYFTSVLPERIDPVPGKKILPQSFEISSTATTINPYKITIHYSDLELAANNIPEEGIGLFYYVGDEWVKEPTAVLDVENNTIIATPNHFSTWALMIDNWEIYLPYIVR